MNVHDRPLAFRLLLFAVAAGIAAYATAAVVRFSTPIDDALPLIAVILCVVAAATRETIGVSVPLLMAGEIALPDERMRLLWFGVVIGAAFAVALFTRLQPAGAVVLTVGAVVLLRWIPLPAARYGREVAVVLIAVLIVAILRFTSFGVAAAVATALFTPMVPLRTLWIAAIAIVIAVLIGQWARRIPAVLGAAALAVMLLFFAWSGVEARALPFIWRGLPRPTQRATVAIALAPGEGVDLDVPPGARALIASGANVPRLRAGAVIGRMDPGGTAIRIGEVADWGVLRLEHHYAARNPLPRNAAGLVREYGYGAWIDGAGRIPLPAATTIHVSAERGLPPAARLQVEAFELGTE